MNHKRHRPKHQRAGCLLCKPHKDERAKGAKHEAPSVRRELQDGDDEYVPPEEQEAMERLQEYEQALESLQPHVSLEKDGDVYLARCHALNIVTSGTTPEEATRRAADMIECYLKARAALDAENADR